MVTFRLFYVFYLYPLRKEEDKTDLHISKVYTVS